MEKSKFIDFYNKHHSGDTSKDGSMYQLQMPGHFYMGVTYVFAKDDTEDLEIYKQQYDQIVKTNREYENTLMWGVKK